MNKQILIDEGAVKLALEALKHLHPTALTSFYTIGDRDRAIEALEEALAKQEQGEPVAYIRDVIEGLYENGDPISVEAAELIDKLYTTPQQRTWVGLTDGQISWHWSNAHNDTTDRMAFQVFARAIEAKLKEKNA